MERRAPNGKLCNALAKMSLDRANHPPIPSGRGDNTTNSKDMTTIKSILATSLIALAFATSSPAATISCETYVASKRIWVKVAPELHGQLNGRVVNLPKYGWVTDSVALGEPFHWHMTASSRQEKHVRSGACVDFVLPNLLRALPAMPAGYLPADGYTGMGTVPVPPGTQVVVVASTEAGLFTVRLPIISHTR